MFSYHRISMNSCDEPVSKHHMRHPRQRQVPEDQELGCITPLNLRTGWQILGMNAAVQYVSAHTISGSVLIAHIKQLSLSQLPTNSHVLGTIR